MTSRFIQLGGGKRRELAENRGTSVGLRRLDGAPLEPPPFERLYERHYARLRDAGEDFGDTGLLVAAVHGELGELEVLGIPCRPGRLNTAIIGRHGQADLYLDRDPGVSLRHAVVLVGSDESERTRVRIIDLRTPLGCVDEHGRRFEAASTDGPFSFRLGSYGLMTLPTRAGERWPATAEEAMAALPERSYTSDPPRAEARPEPAADDGPPTDRRQRRTNATARKPRHLFTYVETSDGPSRACRESLLGEEAPWGRLKLATDRGSDTLVVGAEAARRGLLIGSYERCDTDYLPVLDTDYLSRIHLLVVADQQDLYAVDTASTNGTTLDGAPVRCARLDPQRTLLLAGAIALRWEPL